MPFLPQEGRLLAPWRACSWTLKGLFLFQVYPRGGSSRCLSLIGSGLLTDSPSYYLFVCLTFLCPILVSWWGKLCDFFSHRRYFFFSQSYTEEQNTQHSTETLSQPISQNVTANLSWKASVISVCRRRSVSSKRWLKCSVKSVSSVREKTLQRVVCVLSHREGAFYFSQIYTEEQNTQGLKQVVPPLPLWPLGRAYICILVLITILKDKFL